jgi:hypothetical protein
MDERKRTITELTDKKNSYLSMLDGFFSDLAKSYITRALAGLSPTTVSLPEEIEKLCRLENGVLDNYSVFCSLEEKSAICRAEISETRNAYTKSIETGTLITEKETDSRGNRRELKLLYIKLGKLILREETLSAVIPNRSAYVLVMKKIAQKEKRLSDIAAENSERANFLRKIGNGVESITARALLSKDHETLDRLAEIAGEQFAAVYTDLTLPASGENAGAVTDTLSETLFMKKLIDEIDKEIADLKVDKQKTTDNWRIDGTSNRKIERLENEIKQNDAEIRKIFSAIGTRIASNGSLELAANENELLSKISGLKSEITEYENQIEKLEASLIIDEERETVSKLERKIAELKVTIAESENQIEKTRLAITEANTRIAQLENK